MRLCRLEQDVALLAQRQLDHAFRRQIGEREYHPLVGNDPVVDAETAALDLAARFTIRCYKSDCDVGGEDSVSTFKVMPRDFKRWQGLCNDSFLKSLSSGRGSLVCCGSAMQQRSSFVRQDLFCLVDL